MCKTIRLMFDSLVHENERASVFHRLIDSVFFSSCFLSHSSQCKRIKIVLWHWCYAFSDNSFCIEARKRTSSLASSNKRALRKVFKIDRYAWYLIFFVALFHEYVYTNLTPSSVHEWWGGPCKQINQWLHARVNVRSESNLHSGTSFSSR